MQRANPEIVLLAGGSELFPGRRARSPQIFSRSTRERCRRWSPAVHFVVDPRAITESTKALLACQVTLGVVDKATSVDGLFDSTFFEKAKSEKSKSENFSKK